MANDQKYIAEYAKEFQRRIGVNINRIHDADMIEWLEQQPSIQGYIKDLIRKDMENRKLNNQK